MSEEADLLARVMLVLWDYLKQSIELEVEYESI